MKGLLLATILVIGATFTVGCNKQPEPALCTVQVDSAAEPYVGEDGELVHPETKQVECTISPSSAAAEDEETDKPSCDHLVNPYFSEPGVDCQTASDTEE